QSSTRVPATFVTSTCPSRSRISPRGASMSSVRTRLSFACARYVSPDSTCSAQRRRKSTANTLSVRKARIATRNASCGVRRYGSETRGSPGRNRPLPRSAKETHLAHAVAELLRREQAARERINGQRQQQVEQQRARHAADGSAGGSGLAEHELQRQLAEHVEHRHDGDGE